MKLLIANRGEIAVRIIRACREMDIATVAVYSEADRMSPHVLMADEAYGIGPPPAASSYLSIDRLLDAARRAGADLVHPGYGFLAENATFAEAVEAAGLTWIGPPPAAIRLMGSKTESRKLARAAGVPLIPGLLEPLDDLAGLEAFVDEHGLPVLLKAVAGGGGKGMRTVRERHELSSAFERARSEGKAFFGDDRVYVERLVIRPRHIEVQVAADRHGGAVYVGERECSIQRRHQKVIEEAPSIALTEATRVKLQAAAVKAIEAIGYTNVGTLEFLLDSDGSFYFMEMNTRLQVEHPVTELVTGLDLVREQIRIAAGEPLSFDHTEARRPRGHAIELRINAEDPNTFAPWPGKITALHMPGGLGVRVDTHVYAGYVVPSNYDSLLAKVIVHDVDRPAALRRARRCLDEMVIEGIRTNIPFLRRIVNNPDFIRGDFDTGFVARLLAERASPA